MRRGNVLADKVRRDGEFAVTAVNENCQLNAARTAQVHDGVQSGTDGSTRIQDVVHQHDALAVDAEGNVGGVDRGSEIGRVVIAIEANIQAAERNVDTLDLLDCLGKLLCQKVAARDDADQSEVFTALVALEDLVRDAGHRSVDGGLVHDDRLGGSRAHRSPSSHVLTADTVKKIDARPLKADQTPTGRTARWQLCNSMWVSRTPLMVKR